MLLAVSASHTLAQNAISVGQILFQGAPVSHDSLRVGSGGTLEFQLRVRVDPGIDSRITGTTIGFQVYSTGPSWTTTTAEFLPIWNSTTAFDLLHQTPEFGVTGNHDTVAFENAVLFGGGAAPGYNEIAWTVKLQLPLSDQSWVGEQICIDSVSNYGPANLNWLWNDLSSEVFPTWGGVRCVTFQPATAAMQIGNAPVTIQGSHCSTLSFDFDIANPGDCATNPTFALLSGPGTINPSTGVWTYNPTLADVGQSMAIQVAGVCAGSQGPSAIVNVVATNAAPTITNCPAGVVGAAVPGTLTLDLDATDTCPGDPQTWSVSGSAVGVFSISNAGVLSFTPAVADIGPHTFTVTVTDGKASASCEIQIDVFPHVGEALTIEKDEGQTGHGALQGQFTEVDVIATVASRPWGAFNLLIAYDPSALNFSGIETDGSVLYEDCKWEYLQYRLGPFGNCVGACPTGMVRIVGFAETNNGGHHPVVGCDPTGKMFSLRFLVSNDRTLECQFVPIRFYWFECGDNTLANERGDTLLISKSVHDYQGFSLQNPYSDDIGPAFGFPTYQGHPDICETSGGVGKPSTIRDIDFFNGGVDIVCANEIDARGDINLDGLAYTIADAVILTNYFVRGLAAFKSLPGQPLSTQAAIAASDVNADGLTLTVGDLVYLIRVVVGDAVAFPRITPVPAEYQVTADHRVIVNQEIGAAYLTVRGDVNPELLADNMTMEHAYDADDDITRVLVYSGPEVLTPETFSGPFIRTGGELLSIEMALYDGTPVAARIGSLLPEAFALEQNYPNPFNPTTTIEFSLPARAEYRLQIFNMQGQQVDAFEGAAEAGTVRIVWDAASRASGVYPYKLSAGDFTATRKMVLLK